MLSNKKNYLLILFINFSTILHHNIVFLQFFGSKNGMDILVYNK